MTKLLLILAFAFAAVLIACDDGNGGVAPTVDVTPAVTASPQPDGETPTTGETPTVEPGVCQPNPDPASADVTEVDSPSANDSVTSPVTVSGRIAAFEARFKITIFDADGGQITDVVASSEEGQVLAPFSEEVAFAVTAPTPACVWVYEASPMDGSPIHVVQIPVTLMPGGGPSVCQTNPDPATADTVQVDSPTAGDSLGSPVTVRGRIAAFEAQFNITIFDAGGGKIVDVPAMSAEGQVLSAFSEEVAFSVSEPTPACLWVYDISERDGSPMEVVQIPVTLRPEG
jgi:hypothetical protein